MQSEERDVPANPIEKQGYRLDFQDDFSGPALDETKWLPFYLPQWTPNHIDFYIDNQKIRRIEQSPKYPMQFMLGIYELPDHLEPEPFNNIWPKVFEVDYVRGYQPIASYR